MLKGIKAILYLNPETDEGDNLYENDTDVETLIKTLSEKGVPCVINELAVVDKDVEYELLKGAKLAYAPKSEEAARRLREDGTILFCGINKANGRTLHDLRSALRYVDFITADAEAALEITGTDNCAAALRELSTVVEASVLNLGEQGALALVDGRPFIVAHSKNQNSFNGDKFLAGFVYGVYSCYELDKCMEYANRISVI